jgi:hypothetical protein
MQVTLMVFAAVLPYYSLGHYFGSKFLSLSHVAAGAVVALFIGQLLLKKRTITKEDVKPLMFFVLFVLAGVIGLLVSSYGKAVWLKGTIQLVGITCMLLIVIAIGQEVKQQPGFYFKLSRILIITLGVFGVIGCLQFVFTNLWIYRTAVENGAPWVSSELGRYFLGRPDFIGGVRRATSLATEPSHFTRFIGAGLGVALIRVGAFGKESARNLTELAPLWACWGIVAGMVVSLSILGWALLITVWSALLFLFVAQRWQFSFFTRSACIILIGMGLLGSSSWQGLQVKLGSMSAVWSPARVASAFADFVRPDPAPTPPAPAVLPAPVPPPIATPMAPAPTPPVAVSKPVARPKPSVTPKPAPAEPVAVAPAAEKPKPVPTPVAVPPAPVETAPVVEPTPPPAPPTKGLRKRLVESVTAPMDAYLKREKDYTHSMSTFALGTNMVVAINNLFRNVLFGGGLGSHPIAHGIYAPDYGRASELNADDAASLLLRLLSESGLIGTFLFLLGMFGLIARAIVALKNTSGTLRMVSVGFVASALGFVVIYLGRNGFYYDPTFWTVMAMTMVVPMLTPARVEK